MVRHARGGTDVALAAVASAVRQTGAGGTLIHFDKVQSMKVIRYVTQHMTRGAVNGMFLAGALMAAGAANAAAGNALAVSHCWIRALPGNLPSGGYFVAMNAGDQPVDLVGVETPAFGMAMLHQSQTQGGTSRMVMVDKVVV